jgi:hypothetical protein
MCDRALLQLINGDRDVMSARRDRENIDFSPGNYLDLSTQERKKADE